MNENRDMAPCILKEVDNCFRGVYCRHHQGDHQAVLFILKAMRTSNLSIYEDVLNFTLFV
jgi:hypothetical protein